MSGTLASDMPTRSLDPTAPAAGAPAGAANVLTAGGEFGRYRILRLLGRGGMGEVHEAEEIGSGRRLAVKVLNRALGDENRSRFLREGRLAASLSHPHTVYVYGTEEIAGVPVIAMELATGGTLKDRIHESGPMPPRTAVDLTRQIIAGLDAAARVGVLHRDVKPSNCFLDRDGRVKVGDFGLSVSTATADETQLTMAGTVLGTPAFASPEQLRGGKLEVPSDIYSVGATLYYLLTGRAPFEDGNLVTLVANVLQDPPVAPSDRQRSVPRDLSAVVLRALAKSPAGRYQTYEEFDAALRPFSSDAPAAAPLGQRFIASIIDSVVVNAPILPLQIGALAAAALESRLFVFLSWLISFAAHLTYYVVLEGKWGASLGKRFVGLRVIADSGERASIAVILIRTVVFLLMMQVPQLSLTLFVGPDFFLRQREGLALLGSQLLMPSMYALGLAILFGRARRSNQYRALHDRLSSTRVIVQPPRAERSARRMVSSPATHRSQTVPLGPYRVDDGQPRTPGALISATDDALHRPVWIRIAAAGDPPIAASRRDLDRAARVRWLGGHRAAPVGWDAFEAPDGVPLVAAVCESTGEWQRLLLQLATELDAAGKAGDLPPLSLARVWVTGHGDVRLLDFVPPCEALDLSAHDDVVEDWQALLHRVAAHLVNTAAGGGSPQPQPLFVSAFVRRLGAREFGTPAAAAAELAAIGDRPVAVSRTRRAGQLAQLSALPLFVLVSFLGFVVVISRIAQQYPGLELMRDAGAELARLETVEASADNLARRRAVETLIAGRFAGSLRDQSFRSGFFPRAFVFEAHGERLDRAVAAHPVVTGEELRNAEAQLTDFIARSERSSNRLRSARGVALVLPVFIAILWLVIALPTLIFAPILRGGFSLRLWGVGVVDRSGSEVSRRRALGRALIAWSPLVAVVVLASIGRRLFGPPDESVAYGILSFVLLGLFLAGVVAALLSPSRGVQDRLAGTWLVPR